jgi:hypothetical protein
MDNFLRQQGVNLLTVSMMFRRPWYLNDDSGLLLATHVPAGLQRVVIHAWAIAPPRRSYKQ